MYKPTQTHPVLIPSRWLGRQEIAGEDFPRWWVAGTAMRLGMACICYVKFGQKKASLNDRGHDQALCCSQAFINASRMVRRRCCQMFEATGRLRSLLHRVCIILRQTPRPQNERNQLNRKKRWEKLRLPSFKCKKHCWFTMSCELMMPPVFWCSAPDLHIRCADWWSKLSYICPTWTGFFRKLEQQYNHCVVKNWTICKGYISLHMKKWSCWKTIVIKILQTVLAWEKFC